MYHNMVYGDHRRFHGPHCGMLPVRRWFEVEVQLQSLQVVTGGALNRVLRKGSGKGVDSIFAYISCSSLAISAPYEKRVGHAPVRPTPGRDHRIGASGRPAAPVHDEVSHLRTSKGRRDALMSRVRYDTGTQVEELIDRNAGDVRMDPPFLRKMESSGA
ncbi:hypothetical protein [Paraburkholderia sp. PGU19]|uniref:hypothetical protein n=1 Tax=Paraburkholderia sp. PGU19 TaxID=2735434 RepID=UPI0015D9C5F0|nr:hypothetical protein [Paraburkholderia sp. PGU19]